MSPGAQLQNLIARRPVLCLGLAFAVLLAAIYGSALDARSLWFPDEPDVAEPARWMWATGDYIVPHLNGVPWIDYPPLVYWLANIAAALTGALNEVSLRLPSLLAAVAMVVMTFAWGAREFGLRAGLWAALALATMPQFLLQAISIHPDMVYAAAQAGGMFLYLRSLEDDLRADMPRLWLRAAAFACFGLSILGKGPLGLLLPGFVLFVWHAARREWRCLLMLAVWSLVSLAVALPWYLLYARAIGADSLLYEIWAQNFARYGDTSRGHGGHGPLYYLRSAWGDWAPWVFILPLAVAAVIARWRRLPAPLRFCALWLLLPLIFFSLAETKRFVYLLPVFPAAALLIGWQLQRLRTERLRLTDWAVRAMALALLLPGLGLTVAGIGLGKPSAWLARRAEDATVLAAMPGFATPVLVLGMILALGGLGALLWSFKPRWTAAIGTIAATMLLTAAWSFGVLFPVTDRLIGYPPHVARIRAELRADETMALYLPSGSNLKMAAFDYYLERPIIVLDSVAAAASELAKPRALLVTDEAGFAELQRADATLAQRVWYRFSLAGPRYVVLRSADRA